MPFYRYECRECASVFKVLHLNGSCDPPTCQQCGSTEVKRLLPRIGVIYKGSGYYTTDHRTESKTTTADKAED